MDTYQTTKWGEVSEDFLFDKMGKLKRARIFLHIAQLFLVLAAAAGVITALSITETIEWNYQDQTILAAVICAAIFVLFFVIWLILFISGDLTGVNQALAEAGEQLEEQEKAENQEKQNNRNGNERHAREKYDDDDEEDDYDDDEDDDPEPLQKTRPKKMSVKEQEQIDEPTPGKGRVVYPSEVPEPLETPVSSENDDDDDWDLDEEFSDFDEDEQEETQSEEDVDTDEEEEVEIPVPVFDEEGERQEKMIAESVRNIISAQTDNPDVHVEDPGNAGNGEEDEMSKEDLGLTRSLMSLSGDIDDDEPMDVLLTQMNNIVRGHFKKQEKEINDLKEKCDSLLRRLDEEQNLRKEAEQALADTLEEMGHMQKVEENTNIEFLPDAPLIELNMDIVIPVVPVPEDTRDGGPVVTGADGGEAPSNVASVFD